MKDIEATGLLVKKSQGEQISNDKFPISNQAQNSNDQNTKYQIPNTKYYDRFRDRIIFPIPDAFGKVVGFTARVAPGGDESQAKYVNTPETSVYHKSQVLYGLDKAKQEIKKQDFTLVVEGNMDVIASHQAGLQNTVAVSGTALTSEQLTTLKRYSDNIKLLFDMDAAGEASIRRSAELAFQKELNVSIVRLPEGKDAAELANKDVKKLIEATRKSTPAMEYLMNSLLNKHNRHDPAGKKIIAKEAAEIIQEFGNEIEKAHWIRKLAQDLEVEENIIRDVVRRADSTRETRPETRSVQAISEKELESRDREEIIQGEIIGLLLSDPLSWKKFAENQEVAGLIPAESLLGRVVQGGPAASYRLENLFPLLKDEGEKNLAQKLYFETKFRVVSGAGVEEIDLADAGERLEKAIQALKKEYNKKRLKTILRDIKKAESAGDRNSLHFLMEEFTKLSQESQ